MSRRARSVATRRVVERPAARARSQSSRLPPRDGAPRWSGLEVRGESLEERGDRVVGLSAELPEGAIRLLNHPVDLTLQQGGDEQKLAMLPEKEEMVAGTEAFGELGIDHRRPVPA